MVRTEFDGLYLELSCHLWDCLPGCRRANILTWKLTKAVAKLQHAAPLLWVHHTPRAGVVSLLVHKHCVHILLQQRSCKARTYYALSLPYCTDRARKTAQLASCQIGTNYNKVATKTLCVLRTLH